MSNENLPSQPDAPTPAVEAGVALNPLDTVPCRESELLERVEEVAHRVAVTTVKHEMHTGPIPSPKQFAEYDAVLPGTALIIREEFQANGRHVRSMEDRGQLALIENDHNNRKTAERLVWVSLGLILLLAVLGHENVAMMVSGTTVVAVITGFLSKTRQNKASQESTEEE